MTVHSYLVRACSVGSEFSCRDRADVSELVFELNNARCCSVWSVIVPIRVDSANVGGHKLLTVMKGENVVQSTQARGPPIGLQGVKFSHRHRERINSRFQSLPLRIQPTC